MANRVREWAEALWQEVRQEVERWVPTAAAVPPRLRAVEVRYDQATPVFRTLVLGPPPEGMDPFLAWTLAAARCVERWRPYALLLALDLATGDPGESLLVVEARDAAGQARWFGRQLYRVEDGRVHWFDGPEWLEPPAGEMILDHAFQRASTAR